MSSSGGAARINLCARGVNWNCYIRPTSLVIAHVRGRSAKLRPRTRHRNRSAQCARWLRVRAPLRRPNLHLYSVRLAAAPSFRSFWRNMSCECRREQQLSTLLFRRRLCGRSASCCCGFIVHAAHDTYVALMLTRSGCRAHSTRSNVLPYGCESEQIRKRFGVHGNTEAFSVSHGMLNGVHTFFA